MTNLCQSVGCLPREGGLYDQDFMHVLGMQYVMEAQEEKREQDRKSRESNRKSQPKATRKRK